MRLPLFTILSSLCVLPSLASAQAAPRSLGSALPEPLSFAGAASTDESGLAGLTFRIASLEQDDNFVSLDQTFATVTADVRARFNPSTELFAAIPFSSFSQTLDVAGVVNETENSSLANALVGVLYSPEVRGPVRLSFGVGAVIPTTDENDNDQVTALFGGISDLQNVPLYLAGKLSLRPEVRVAFDAGALVLQGLFGVDVVLNDNENVDNDETLVRVAGSAAFALSPGLALMGELNIVDDLDDQENDELTTLHLGTRMTLNTLQGNKLYPAVQLVIPVSDAIKEFVDVGLSVDLRASF